MQDIINKIRDFAENECLKKFGIADTTIHETKNDFIINTGKNREYVIRIGLHE